MRSAGLCLLLVLALALCASTLAAGSSERRRVVASSRASSLDRDIHASPIAYNNPNVDMDATQIEALIAAASDEMPLAAWTAPLLTNACRTPNSPTGVLSCTNSGFPTVINVEGRGVPSIYLGRLAQLTHLNLTLTASYRTQLPVAWANLTQLTTLTIGPDAKLYGALPEEWSAMTSLTSLNITFTEAPISRAVLESVQNSVQSSVPSWLANLTDLSLTRYEFGIQNIPDALFTSNSLTTLILNNCIWPGTIPDVLTSNTVLEHLVLSKFQNVPALAPSPFAARFTLDSPSGYLPSNFSGMTSLKTLTLGNLPFDSAFPASWPQSIVSLTFYNLKFMTGTVPQSLFDIPSLAELYLAGVSVTGAFPGPSSPALSNMKSIEVFDTKMTGPISSAWFFIPSLTSFELYGMRQFQPFELGPFPSVASGACKIQNLRLTGLALSGSLPDAFFSICADLSVVRLAENYLVGSIPSDWSNSNGRLQILYLDGNRLTGSIPAGIKWSDSGEKELGVYYNLLTGPLPDNVFHQNWTYFDLESNNIDICANLAPLASADMGECWVQQDSTPYWCPCKADWIDAGCGLYGNCDAAPVYPSPSEALPPYTPAEPLPPAFYPPPISPTAEEPASSPAASPSSPASSPLGNPISPLGPNTPTPSAATTPNVPTGAASSASHGIATVLASVALIALIMC